MKRYLGIFIGMAALIMTIPCFAFVGTDKPLKPQDASTAEASSKVQSATAKADSFQIYNHKTQKVETVAAADYIKGVVAAEMPADYHTEALKAQAVAAHTYALKMKQQEEKSPNKLLHGADISTDPATSQAYMSTEEIKAFYGDKFESSYKKISDAVDAVLDQVILYDGEPIAAAFHAISGGTTEDAANIWGRSLAYLKPVLSNGDLLSPDYETKTELTADEVKAKLTAKYSDLKLSDNPADWIVIKTRTASQSVKEADVGGKTVSGTELRAALELKSNCFTVSYADGAFTFTAKGNGHGVGMSQYGADYLARQGKTYDEILKYYYTDVVIGSMQ